MTIDVSDPPFKLPKRELISHMLDLPFPPSVNVIWRANKGGKNRISRSPVYRKWIRDADTLVTSMAALRGCKPILGRFGASISLVRPRQPCDLDNRIKVVLDYCQRVNLIADDKHCCDLRASWTTMEFAPAGCRVTLWELA
jgi:Holliday junction resolvase RusA-like endonuclease